MQPDIFSLPFPTFELSSNFVLDQIKPDFDSGHYFLYMNAPEVKNFISDSNIPESINSAKQDLQYWASLFNTRRSVYWAIREQSNDKLIGTIGFNNISFINMRGEISYDLAYDYWGKGIMTKAINTIAAFAQEKMGLVRVQAYTARNNKKSIKLLERCKFTAEGILRKYERVQNKSLDYVMYAVVK